MIAIAPNTSVNHSNPLPYLACLISGLPPETQDILRFIRNSLFLPLDLISAILSILCNISIVIAVTRIKIRHHPSLTFFCSLSVSYLLSSLFHLYKTISTFVHVHRCPTESNTQRFISGLCIIAALCNLVLISQDRHRAITRPLWYQNHMTNSRARKECVITVSSYAMILTVLRELGRIREEFLLVTKIIVFISAIACSFMIVSFYVAIYVEVKKIHRRNIPQCGARQSAVALTREKKITKTVALILLALVTTHLPALLIALFFWVYNDMYLKFLRPFLSALFSFNGILNPIITLRRNEAIQISLRQFFGFQDQRQGPLWAIVQKRHALSIKGTKQSTANPKQLSSGIHSTSSDSPN